MSKVSTLIGSEEELKSFLIRMKEENEKAVLKLNKKKTKSMASSLITSWQVEGLKVETVTDFIVLGSKSLQTVTRAMRLKAACSLEKKL